MSILIKNAYLLTMDQNSVGEIPNGYVFIENNLISKLGDNSTGDADCLSVFPTRIRILE
jgi:hypothetical protein